jgi:type 1 glutamine amidotransferase
VLRAAQLENQNPKPETLSVVLVASKQDHGPGEHDYPAWQKKWNPLLASAPAVTVRDAWEWPTSAQFTSAHVIVFYYWNHDWSPARYAQLDEYLARGGGLVVLHSATIADKDPEPLAERLGLAAQPQRTRYLHCPFELTLTASTNHPITLGLPRSISFLDEPYWPMIGDAAKVEVLATTEQEGKAWPMIWTLQKGNGRVFASILGHYSWTHDDPMFRILVLRGLAWAAGAEVRRLEKLAVQGVEFRP